VENADFEYSKHRSNSRTETEITLARAPESNEIAPAMAPEPTEITPTKNIEAGKRPLEYMLRQISRPDKSEGVELAI
jgi:hypothetical protein